MFYAYWESYCTCKSYVWREKFDTREAANRQIRRLMEQDNKKLRDKAKRERNEEVRVGFYCGGFVIKVLYSVLLTVRLWVASAVHWVSLQCQTSSQRASLPFN